MATVLIISPDEDLLQALAGRVASAGCLPLVSADLEEAQLVLAQAPVDAVCVDWEFEAEQLAELRAWLGPVGRRERAPVILLVSPVTALVPDLLPPFLEPDRDRVIAKPVVDNEFDLALGMALAAGGRFDPLALDADSLQLRAGPDAFVPLTPGEFHLLRYLMQHPGRVVPAAELAAALAAGRPAPDVAAVRARVRSLQAKLRRRGLEGIRLRAVGGRGYLFAP